MEGLEYLERDNDKRNTNTNPPTTSLRLESTRHNTQMAFFCPTPTVQTQTEVAMFRAISICKNPRMIHVSLGQNNKRKREPSVTFVRRTKREKKRSQNKANKRSPQLSCRRCLQPPYKNVNPVVRLDVTWNTRSKNEDERLTLA